MHETVKETPTTDFGLFKSHKQVRAFRIANIIMSTSTLPEELGHGSAFLYDDYGKVRHVTKSYMDKHTPHIGGYWVFYPSDEYQSFSPARSFENGYTIMPESSPMPSAKEEVYPADSATKPADLEAASPAEGAAPSEPSQSNTV